MALNGERPYSTLILTLQNTSLEQVQEIAPGTSRQLKRFVKAPMVSQLCMAGIQAGITSSFFKWFGEIMAQGKFEPDDIWIATVCLVIAVASSLLQLTFLNKAIACYQQVEVIAIYQVTIMIFTIMCALILLDEAEAYTQTGLLWLLGTVALMIAGIQVVTWKTNKLATINDKE